MIKKLINKTKNKNFIIMIVIFLLLLQLFNFFLNLNYIKKNNYESRMINAYGYCEKYSYGFIKKVLNKYKKANFNLLNKKNLPPIKNMFLDDKFDNKSNFVIALNFKKKELEKKFPNLQIILNEEPCYLIKYD